MGAQPVKLVVIWEKLIGRRVEMYLEDGLALYLFKPDKAKNMEMLSSLCVTFTFPVRSGTDRDTCQ